MQFKSFRAIIGAFVGALLVFTVTEMIGTFFIENIYLSPERSRERLENVLEDFRAFVNEEHLSVREVDAVSKWCDGKLSVTIGVYDGDTLLYNTDGSFLMQVVAWNEDGVVIESVIDDYGSPPPDKGETFPVTFSDGTYSITVNEYSEMLLGEGLTWLSLGLALFVLIFSLIFFNGRIVSRIVALSREIGKVRAKDSSGEIRRDGNDEITALGDAADEMRRAIILYYEKEQEALQSNSELLTALSHDIRTPLTSLMIYIDAIADGSIQDPEEQREYAEICRRKVHQIKHLTDTLFSYFLLFGKPGVQVQVQKEKFLMSELIVQLLSEPLFELSQKEIPVKTSLPETDAVITVDPSLLKRVFDNLFSNIEKYADRARPITVGARVENRTVSFELRNYPAEKKPETESSKIGLRSCEKIMDMLGGTFEKSCSEDGAFVVTFSLPVEPLPLTDQ